MNLSRLCWPCSTKTNEPLTSSQPSRQTAFRTSVGSAVRCDVELPIIADDDRLLAHHVDRVLEDMVAALEREPSETEACGYAVSEAAARRYFGRVCREERRLEGG